MKNSHAFVLGVPLLLALACGGTAAPGDGSASGGSTATGSSASGGSGGGVPSGGSGGDLGTGGAATGGAATGGDAGLDPLEGECRSGKDCESYEFCFEPGKSPPNGVCFDIEAQCTNQGLCTVCDADEDCSGEGPTSICKPVFGACDAGNICQAGCSSSSDCGEGESCSATHRCAPAACEDVTDCPLDFACTDKQCTRISCNSEEDCAGHCVNDRCFSDFGACRAIPG